MLIALSLLLFFSTLVISQENKTDTLKVENLEEVIVTATRTVRQLSSLPLPAQIVSKKEIESVNSIRLSDILNEQTGLLTVPDFGGNVFISIWVLLPGIGGTFTRMGYVNVLFVTELIGLILIYVGYRIIKMDKHKG